MSLGDYASKRGISIFTVEPPDNKKINEYQGGQTLIVSHRCVRLARAGIAAGAARPAVRSCVPPAPCDVADSAQRARK